MYALALILPKMTVDIRVFKFEIHVTVELVPKGFSQSEVVVEIGNQYHFTNFWL